jgi:hypothetical protein
MSTLAFLRVARSMNLTLLDLLVLYEVRRANGCKMSDVSRSFGAKNAGHAYQATNRLAQRDLLDLGQSRPGRQMKISLTVAGAAVLNELEGLNYAEALFPGGGGDGSNFPRFDAEDQRGPKRQMA